jgi:hypothetical protein
MTFKAIKGVPVHAVGVYEATGNREKDGEPIKISVQTEEEIILYLSSYENLNWEIAAQKPESIKQIL